jgi:peptidoglycan/xylan/chitin deacetylase (PgdA/CDA1 family)
MNSILLFHAVTDGEWFDDIISWLKRRVRLVPIDLIDAFYEGSPRMNNACHITVDDGDASFYNVMFPILKRHRVHASLFVSPKMCAGGGNFWFQEIDCYSRSLFMGIAAEMLKIPARVLGGFSTESICKALPVCQITELIRRYQCVTGIPQKLRQNSSVDELKEIVASGLVTIGAHTVNHPILMNEDDATCEYEIAASLGGLTTLLGSQTSYFAYPNGIAGMDFGNRERRILRSCGVRMAFTTESRTLSIYDDRLQIPRLAISNGESLMSVRAKMLLGSNWNRLKTVAGIGEQVERRRLNHALSRHRQIKAGGRDSFQKPIDPLQSHDQSPFD